VVAGERRCYAGRRSVGGGNRKLFPFQVGLKHIEQFDIVVDEKNPRSGYSVRSVDWAASIIADASVRAVCEGGGSLHSFTEFGQTVAPPCLKLRQRTARRRSAANFVRNRNLSPNSET